MCIQEYFEDWLQCYESNKPIIIPKASHFDCDSEDYAILSDVYEWLNNHYKENTFAYNIYHLYTAYISTIILLSKDYNPITMHDMKELYVNHHKTVSKAFEQSMEKSQEWLYMQLQRICDVANMLQQKHPEFCNRFRTTNLTFADISLPHHKYSDDSTEESESEYDEISDFIDPADDVNLKLAEKKQVSIHPIIDKLCELLVGEYIYYKPTHYVNIYEDPINGMIHDIIEWLVHRHNYENYHIYRIWYVTRMLISNGFHNFEPEQVIEEMLEEWSEYPEEMEKCFDNSYHASDVRHPEIAQINKIYIVLVQFQKRWSCLQDIEFGKIPMFLDVSLKQDYSFHVNVSYNNKDHPVNITSDYDTIYKKHTASLHLFLSALRNPKVKSIWVTEEDVNEFKKYVNMLNNISRQL